MGPQYFNGGSAPVDGDGYSAVDATSPDDGESNVKGIAEGDGYSKVDGTSPDDCDSIVRGFGNGWSALENATAPPSAAVFRGPLRN